MWKIRGVIGVLYSPKYLLYTNMTISVISGMSADIVSQIIEQSFTQPKTGEPGQQITYFSKRVKFENLSRFGVKFEWDRRRTGSILVFI